MAPTIKNDDYFRILSLDGASITGGMGWVSIGALRDKLHLHLELTPQGQTHLSPYVECFEKELGLSIPPRKSRRSKPPKPLAPIAFLNALHKLSTQSQLPKEIQVFALWLRFTQVAASRKSPQFQSAPLSTELAVMLSAYQLFQAKKEIQSRFFSELGNMASGALAQSRQTKRLQDGCRFEIAGR